MKYPLVDHEFSLFKEKLSEIPLVSLGEISDTFTLNSENLGSTSGISAKFHLFTLVSVGFTLKQKRKQCSEQKAVMDLGGSYSKIKCKMSQFLGDFTRQT